MGTHEEHDTERDPMIARALGQVPVPPRPAGFLDRLDEALDAVDEERRSPAMHTPTTHPGETVPVDLTDPRSDTDVADLSTRRQAKNGRRYRVLAAAASVAVILGGVAVLARDDATTTTVDPAGESPGTGATQPAEEEAFRRAALESAVDGVAAWSAALAASDADEAWRLMGPLSQKYLTEQGGWEEMVATMGEGSFTKWHAYQMPALNTPPKLDRQGDAPTRALVGHDENGLSVKVAFLPDTEQAAVVTLSDVLELEGTREKVLDSFPLTREGDGPWRIEPFAFGPGETLAEFVLPGLAPGGGLEDVEQGFTLEVAAPGAEAVSIDADGGQFRALQRSGGNRWTDPFSEGLPGGTVQYVVVTQGPDFLTAHPVEFFVKEGTPAACPNMGFTPNSDDVASEITVVRGDCAEAEQLVRHVHEEMKHSFFDGPRYFTALSYGCTVRTESEGLESGVYRCTNGATLISWRKT